MPLRALPTSTPRGPWWPGSRSTSCPCRATFDRTRTGGPSTSIAAPDRCSRPIRPAPSPAPWGQVTTRPLPTSRASTRSSTSRSTTDIHLHRLDSFRRGQLEPQHLPVEGELRVQRPADVLRAPEAVLLARELQVCDGHAAAAEGVDDQPALRGWDDGVLAALQHDERTVEAVDVMDG